MSMRLIEEKELRLKSDIEENIEMLILCFVVFLKINYKKHNYS
jgi:hypothetical protein